MRPIIKEMLNNSGGAFSGFGHHLVNDFLFNVAIHPGTLAISISENNGTFAKLLEGIPEYLELFTMSHFYKTMESSCVTGRKNPFEFNEDSFKIICNIILMYSGVVVSRFLKNLYKVSGKGPSGYQTTISEFPELSKFETVLFNLHSGQPYSPETLNNFFKINASNSLKNPQNISRI